MHIIGGGIIGLCCAWYLKRAGYEVTIVDRTDMMDGCSFGNSGIIVPSHSIPLASPGVVAQGIRWMFNARSPFFIRPRPDPELLRWLWRFYKSCTKAHVDKVAPMLRDFHLLSKSLFQEFCATQGFHFDLEEKGSLMLYRTEKGKTEELAHAERASRMGLQVSALSQEDVRGMDPGMQYDILGGVYYQDDAHLYPGKFVSQLQAALKAQGVEFVPGHSVTGFETSGRRITHLRFDHAPSMPVREAVLCAGAWSAQLAKRLGIRLLIQDGKGYSVTLRDHMPRPGLPAILSEARVAVTPMGSDLRIGGTLEVSHFSEKMRRIRVASILRAMTRYYRGFPELAVEQVNVWHGFRPVTADGVPYIGRHGTYHNLIIATGHAMLGMSLGPATGLLVSEIAQDRKSTLPLEVFDPGRHAE